MTRKKNTKKSSKNIIILAIIIIALLLSIIAIAIRPNKEEPISENMEDVFFELDNGIVITKIGSYTGPYMEDASDEEVSNVMMILVRNNAEKALQYTEITLSGKAGNALFKISTLNPGESAVVLESGKKVYSENDKYTEASAQYTVFFEEKLSVHEDKLKIQPLNGGFNITNISNEDIAGEIMVYFKDVKNDMLMGGITYRGHIKGGLKKDELRQIMSNNFTETNTKVMFVTITETEE